MEVLTVDFSKAKWQGATTKQLRKHDRVSIHLYGFTVVAISTRITQQITRARVRETKHSST